MYQLVHTQHVHRTHREREKFLGLSVFSLVVAFFLSRYVLVVEVVGGCMMPLHLVYHVQHMSSPFIIHTTFPVFQHSHLLFFNIHISCFSTFTSPLLSSHSIGTVLFYALGISLVAVGIHGAMRVPDDLFLDEPEVCVLGGGCLGGCG